MRAMQLPALTHLQCVRACVRACVRVLADGGDEGGSSYGTCVVFIGGGAKLGK